MPAPARQVGMLAEEQFHGSQHRREGGGGKSCGRCKGHEDFAVGSGLSFRRQKRKKVKGGSPLCLRVSVVGFFPTGSQTLIAQSSSTATHRKPYGPHRIDHSYPRF